MTDDYDKLETPPLGAHMYLGLVHSITGKTADQLNLLDCGCGPGEYVKFFFQQGLGEATIIDCSDTILETAKTRLKNYLDRLKLLNATLPNFSHLQNASYDVVTVNSLLHHLHEPNSEDFTKISQSLQEIYRILKPGGMIVIAECTPLQDILHWIPAYPKYAKDILALVLPSKVITDLLEETKFSDIKRVIFPDDKIDPIFIYTGEEELDLGTEVPDYRTLVSMVTNSEERESLYKYENCLEELKETIGMYTIYYAQKPL